jgi:hypothetical protein
MIDHMDQTLSLEEKTQAQAQIHAELDRMAVRRKRVHAEMEERSIQVDRIATCWAEAQRGTNHTITHYNIPSSGLGRGVTQWRKPTHFPLSSIMYSVLPLYASSLHLGFYDDGVQGQVL